MTKGKNRKVFDFGRLGPGAALAGTKLFTTLNDALYRPTVKIRPEPKPSEPKPLEVAAVAALEAWEAWLSTGPGQIHLSTVAGPGKAVADAMEDMKTALVEVVRKDVER